MRRLRNNDSRPEQEAAILKAAAEEVALVGVGRASMDVIARQAGVSRSTLYRRFPSRDALITELGRQTFDFAMARLQTVGIETVCQLDRPQCSSGRTPDHGMSGPERAT